MRVLVLSGMVASLALAPTSATSAAASAALPPNASLRSSDVRVHSFEPEEARAPKLRGHVVVRSSSDGRALKQVDLTVECPDGPRRSWTLQSVRLGGHQETADGLYSAHPRVDNGLLLIVFGSVDSYGGDDEPVCGTPALQVWSVEFEIRLPRGPCVVPRVVGKSLSVAVGAVARANCSSSIRFVPSRRVKQQYVAAQRPKAGTRLRTDGVVTLLVSRGPK